MLAREAPESEAEMATIGQALADTGKPLLVNCVEGGKTPLLSKQRYIERPCWSCTSIGPLGDML